MEGHHGKDLLREHDLAHPHTTRDLASFPCIDAPSSLVHAGFRTLARRGIRTRIFINPANRFRKKMARCLPSFCAVKSFLMQGNSYKGQKFAVVHFEGLGERHAACSIPWQTKWRATGCSRE
jgi:hypothetical protein